MTITLRHIKRRDPFTVKTIESRHKTKGSRHRDYRIPHQKVTKACHKDSRILIQRSMDPLTHPSSKTAWPRHRPPDNATIILPRCKDKFVGSRLKDRRISPQTMMDPVEKTFGYCCKARPIPPQRPPNHTTQPLERAKKTVRFLQEHSNAPPQWPSLLATKTTRSCYKGTRVPP